ncbi:hypothetical protein [Paenibacillus polymyxa]|uniref:hypothetical protein n=1 Tax=Paenibacillus polymyxa TaxID=1406 RepID=UPI000F4E1F80|nr:hypothetical protein [Paenibacillus polymyxa]MEE4581547.1 hypothetical protein [Paenibacillus polymyxa]RPE03270.1 hypothetical protein EG487_14840 [Paenibacillus polymyxa]
MTDKPDWEKRMDYCILEAQKEKSRADGVEKRLYFLDTENEILKRNIKVLVDTQKESESLIQQKDAEIYHLKKSIEALLMHRGMTKIHDEPDLTHVQAEHASGDIP